MNDQDIKDTIQKSMKNLISDQELENRIKEIVKNSSMPITRESISFILAIQRDILINQTLIKLIQEGKIEAEYKNKNTDDISDTNNYILKNRT